MKKILILGLAVLFIGACQNKPERFFTSSAEIDSVKSLVEDYHNGDWEAWVEHYADTAKIYHNTWENSATVAETVEGLKEILSNTSSYHFKEGEGDIFYEMTIDDDGKTWVNFWGLWQGTLAANGEVLEIPVHLSIRFVDGKIIREYGFYDLSKFVASLNAIEAAKEAEIVEEDLSE